MRSGLQSLQARWRLTSHALYYKIPYIYLYWKQKKNPEKPSTNNSGSEEQIKYKQVFLSWKKYTFIHVFCFHTILNLRKRLLRLDHCCVWLERARCHGVICRCHLRPQWRVTISPSWLRDKINHLIFAVHLRPLHSKKLVIRATEFQTGDDRI